MKVLLTINVQKIIEKINTILKRYVAMSETEHLLSTEANRKHITDSIDQLNKGNGVSIKTLHLWK